jgi:hypothetical protein
MTLTASITEAPAYPVVERRCAERRSGVDRRRAGDEPVTQSPAVLHGRAAAPVVVTGRAGVRGRSCRRCAYAHPRSDERGGIRLCVAPDAPACLVIGDQHACGRFAEVPAG